MGQVILLVKKENHIQAEDLPRMVEGDDGFYFEDESLVIDGGPHLDPEEIEEFRAMAEKTGDILTSLDLV